MGIPQSFLCKLAGVETPPDARCAEDDTDDTHHRGATMFALTIVEVRDEWNRRSGQRLSRSRVWQILRQAEAKLRRALRGEIE